MPAPVDEFAGAIAIDHEGDLRHRVGQAAQRHLANVQCEFGLAAFGGGVVQCLGRAGQGYGTIGQQPVAHQLVAPHQQKHHTEQRHDEEAPQHGNHQCLLGALHHGRDAGRLQPAFVAVHVGKDVLHGCIEPLRPEQALQNAVSRPRTAERDCSIDCTGIFGKPPLDHVQPALLVRAVRGQHADPGDFRWHTLPRRTVVGEERRQAGLQELAMESGNPADIAVETIQRGQDILGLLHLHVDAPQAVDHHEGEPRVGNDQHACQHEQQRPAAAPGDAAAPRGPHMRACAPSARPV